MHGVSLHQTGLLREWLHYSFLVLMLLNVCAPFSEQSITSDLKIVSPDRVIYNECILLPTLKFRI